MDHPNILKVNLILKIFFFFKKKKNKKQQKLF